VPSFSSIPADFTARVGETALLEDRAVRKRRLTDETVAINFFPKGPPQFRTAA
jgi:hypothetical protein